MIFYPVTVGSVAGNPLTINTGYSLAPTSDIPVEVTLTEAYTMFLPPGFPTRPHWVGTGARLPYFTQTLPVGYTYAPHQVEADALVSIGAATYVDQAYSAPIFPNYPIASNPV